MQKVATLGQRGHNGDRVKVFWGTSTVDQLHPTPIIFVSHHGTHICPKHFYNPMRSPICAFYATLEDMAPPKDPPFQSFSHFCQSLVQNDVTAVADTRACYTSFERTQKNEQNSINTIVNFASLGKTTPQSWHLKKASFYSKFKAPPYWIRKAQFYATYAAYALHSLI